MRRAMAGSELSGDLAELTECFGVREGTLLRTLPSRVRHLPENLRRQVLTILDRAAQAVPPLVRSIEATPVHQNYEYVTRAERSAESLIENLCRSDWQTADLTVPSRTIVGRALVIVRINVLKSLRYSLEPSRDSEALLLQAELQELIDDAVFSKLAEELLTGVVSNVRNSPALRRAAARHLLEIWNNLVHQPVVAFPTALLSAWKARKKVQTTYGTLFGIQELVSLIREECEPDFVAFFTRDQVTTDQAEAFREFLFGLPYEELQQLQAHMRDEGIPVLSREQVYQLVNKTLPDPGGDTGPPTAEEVFASYRRRRLRAEYRSLAGIPGPQKTAEGYIMEFLLEEEMGGR